MWDWYNLFNLTDWLATGLLSRTLPMFLEGRGDKDILITQGNETAITIDDQFLPLNFNDENPWVNSGYAIYVDENQDVWVGLEVSS